MTRTEVIEIIDDHLSEANEVNDLSAMKYLLSIKFKIMDEW